MKRKLRSRPTMERRMADPMASGADRTERNDRLRVTRAIIVEGKDDVDAVSRACDALIIPTHGYGITQQTWKLLQKAYDETGVIILTDPDHAGEEIRKRLTDRFPDAVQCYIAREDAEKADDIGVENSSPETIRRAVERALELHKSADEGDAETGSTECFESAGNCGDREVTMIDLTQLGLAGGAGASQLRSSVSRDLGIGYSNAKTMLARLRHFRIGYDELASAVDRNRILHEEK